MHCTLPSPLVSPAGKSSVFQAILQNMQLQSGEMAVGGSISYVPQTPWVQNLTLKDNILFGLPFDEARYKQVRSSTVWAFLYEPGTSR
jgi:ABC-type transport system involved in cytochrome bd biosynthesis fused ATPase/permease subunit